MFDVIFINYKKTIIGSFDIMCHSKQTRRAKGILIINHPRIGLDWPLSFNYDLNNKTVDIVTIIAVTAD